MMLSGTPSRARRRRPTPASRIKHYGHGHWSSSHETADVALADQPGDGETTALVWNGASAEGPNRPSTQPRRPQRYRAGTVPAPVLSAESGRAQRRVHARLVRSAVPWSWFSLRWVAARRCRTPAARAHPGRHLRLRIRHLHWCSGAEVGSHPNARPPSAARRFHAAARASAASAPARRGRQAARPTRLGRGS